MKPAFVATVLLALLVCLAPSCQGEQHTTQAPNKPRNELPSSGSQTYPDSKAASPKNETPHWCRSPECALVIVGIVTALVIGWQSWETRKSAEAALLNAQAIIHSERPWLIVSVDENRESSVPGRFWITVKNTGRTPAQLVSGGFSHSFHETAEGLLNPPRYAAFLLSNSWFLPPQDSFRVCRSLIEKNEGINPEAIIASRPVNEGPFTDILFFYGNIVYRDTLRNAGSEQASHETRWCFAYLRSIGFVRTGPNGGRSKEYNNYT